jgi:NADPH-dependent 2,4-dienoyl-CoA reductase/sulfur reductase-like enzyme
MAFPGWHLPGVITPGGAQMLLQGHGIRPGRRALVAGSGPLLLAAAAGLVEVGTEVVAMLDLASVRDGLLKVPQAFWGQKDRLKEAWKYIFTLKRKRVPLLLGHTIFHALGNTEVTGAAYGRVDRRWRPLKRTEKVVEVDTICVALGYLPNLTLTRHLECEHSYDPDLDTFYPKHTTTMETTTSNVYVAGDVTGVGGKEVAKLQGQVAGLNILGQLGYLSPAQVKARVQALGPNLKRELRFTRMLSDRLRIRPGIFDLLDEKTIICRCEMVRVGQISAAIADGARNIRGVKLRTRCGMGPCQGRYCESNVAHLIARASNQPRQAVGTMSVRPPLIPILMKDMSNPRNKA